MSYEEQVPGKAIAAKEPGRDLDLYVDFRQMTETVTMPPELQDPTKVTREGVLNTARGFARANPNARFAVLRIWSAPHFYPLMIGYERRWTVSFADGWKTLGVEVYPQGYAVLGVEHPPPGSAAYPALPGELW